MIYHYKDKNLEPVRYFDYSEIKGKEKDLENLLAANLSDLFAEGLMPVFQERPIQSEPDLCALDRDGNLVIFELKRGYAWDYATKQIMGYAQVYGQKGYSELNDMYKKYMLDAGELKEAHASAFELPVPLNEEEFNNRQKFIIIGNAADISLIHAVDYWKSQNLDIHFLPYRFYEINGEIYFEFFAPPYDYHVNAEETKGIIFDTCRRYLPDAEAQMLKNGHVEAYGEKIKEVDRFNKGDYVLFFAIMKGIIAIGKVTSKKAKDLPDEETRYHEVDMIVPKVIPENVDELKSIPSWEIGEILGRGICYQGTCKRPFLNEEQVKLFIEKLEKKYQS